MANYSNKYGIEKGYKFGKWTVISDVILSGPPRYSSKRKCLCECGTIRTMDEYRIMNDPPLSCGCLNRVRPDIEIGKKYGQLTVISEAPKKYYPNTNSYEKRWLCKCECGNEVIKDDQDIKMAKNPFCRLPDHDKRRINPNIVRFLNMANALKLRCTNPTNPNFVHWGGRGIKCELGDAVIDIADSLSQIPGYFEGATIDRIDNDGNYTLWHPEHAYKEWIYHDDILNKDFRAKGNLRWVTVEENATHVKETKFLKHDFGKKLMSKKGFMHNLDKSSIYEDFIAFESSAVNRNSLPCFLFLHKDLLNTLDEEVDKFKKYWSDNNGTITISKNPIKVTNEFLGVKTYGKDNLSFRQIKVSRDSRQILGFTN